MSSRVTDLPPGNTRGRETISVEWMCKVRTLQAARAAQAEAPERQSASAPLSAAMLVMPHVDGVRVGRRLATCRPNRKPHELSGGRHRTDAHRPRPSMRAERGLRDAMLDSTLRGVHQGVQPSAQRERT